MSHRVASLPDSNLDRLNRMVPKKEEGGMVGRATLPLKGPPQQPWRNPKPWNMPIRDDFIKPSPAYPPRDGMVGVALKKKGGQVSSHPEEKLMMGQGKKSLH